MSAHTMRFPFVSRLIAVGSLACLTLAGCTASTGDGSADSSDQDLSAARRKPKPACGAEDARKAPLELFVEPDAASTPYVDTIDRAQKSVDVLIYEMGRGPVLDALIGKARAGVSVRVIMDVSQKAVNQGYFDQLTQAGAHCLWSDPAFSFMHAKVIVVDGKEAIVSTGNFAQKLLARERNYVVRDTDPSDVDVLGKLFEADFSRSAPDLSCTRLLVSPVNAKDRLLAFIASATTSIEVESMQLADFSVRSALAERKAAGVEVRVLLADPSWITANSDAATFLTGKQIPVKRLVNPNVHVKSIIVDGHKAYAGSINLSSTSMTKNREVGLIIQEPENVQTMLSTFETDWSAGSDFATTP